MQLSNIKKLKTYYNDLVNADEMLPKKMHISLPTFAIKAIASYIIYGTSFSEFAGYGFYAKKRSEKLTYMTRRHMFSFFDRYNPLELRERIGNKSLAVLYYAELLNREQYAKREGLEKFIEFSMQYRDLFIKKSVGWGGEGAKKVKVETIEDARKIWNNMTADVVAEPVVENHERIKEIHPQSLNTIKVTVLQTPEGPKIVTAIVRFGNDTIVDNVHSGGMAAGINIANGIIETPAMDKHFQKYKVHPKTNRPITGFMIPDWEKVKELAIRAANVTPQLRYTSWDIAVTDSGPVMIEGNWDAEFYMEQTLYNRGHRKLFTDLLEGRA